MPFQVLLCPFIISMVFSVGLVGEKLIHSKGFVFSLYIFLRVSVRLVGMRLVGVRLVGVRLVGVRLVGVRIVEVRLVGFLEQ